MHLLSETAQVEPTTAVTHTHANRENTKWIVAAAALVVVFLGTNFKLVTGEHCVVWDADGLFAPAYTLIADHARAGRILLWNPWRSGGSPDYAEPQMGATSPIMVFMGALTGGTEAGFRWYYLLIWSLGGIGMLLLARHLRVRPWGAFIIALGFLFSGFYTGHGQHTTPLYSLSLVPFMLWRLDVALASGRLWPAIETGALWGLSSLGGYPQNTIISAGFLMVWVLGRVLCAGRNEPNLFGDEDRPVTQRLRLAFASLALLVAVGAVVLAPPYISFFTEGHGYSDRVGPRPREEAVSSMPTPLGAWSTFSSPYLTEADIWGSPRLWPTTDGTFTNVYMGVLTPILGLLALLSCPRSRWRWWLFVMAVFWFCCSLGDQLPLRGWLYDYVPSTRYFRNPGWFREYAMLCISVLALLALKDIQVALQKTRSKIWIYLLASALFLSAAAIASYVHFVHKVQVQTANYDFANWTLAMLWSATIVAAVSTLNHRSRRALPMLLAVVAVADAVLTFQISRETVSSNGPGLAIWRRIDKSHNPSLMLADLNRFGIYRPFNDAYWHNKNIPMKIASFVNDDTMRNRFQMDFWSHPVLMEMSTGRDRIWFSDTVSTAAPTSDAYRAFVHRSESLNSPVLVVHAPQSMNEIRDDQYNSSYSAMNAAASISKLPAAKRVPVKLLRYSPNHLDLIVSCPSNGWLLVTDRWAHGWRANVNGHSVPVFGGNFIFRAVQVEEGDNRVEFSYSPTGFPYLLIISWGTLGLVLILPHVSRTRVRVTASDGHKLKSKPDSGNEGA